MKLKTMTKILPLALMTISLSSYAQGGGDKVGGGGDASEIRVNEIRQDILDWIQNGGSQELDFQNLTTLEDYNAEMSKILKPKTVEIVFVKEDSLSDEELTVRVAGKPKTCRGFISKVSVKPTILCNIQRFKETKESDQYKLIHHEYAGLAGLERNEEAASDYYLSAQLTDYLVPETLLKLALKKRQTVTVVNDLKIIKNPTWHSRPFEGYGSNSKNKLEADKICLTLTSRRKYSIDYSITEVTKEELAGFFPAVINGDSPFGGEFQMMGQIVIDGQGYDIPSNPGYVRIDQQVIISKYKRSQKIKYFSSVTCK